MQQSSPYDCAELREEPGIRYIGLFEVGHISPFAHSPRSESWGTVKKSKQHREKKSLIHRSFVTWKEQISAINQLSRDFFFVSRQTQSCIGNLPATLTICVARFYFLFISLNAELLLRLACLAFNWWLYIARSFYCQLDNWINEKFWLIVALMNAQLVCEAHTTFR